jgi:hypothetical protein
MFMMYVKTIGYNDSVDLNPFPLTDNGLMVPL